DLPRGLVRPLLPGEEVRLGAHDRAADAASELVPLVLLLRQVADALGERPCVEAVVAQQREPASAHLVRAALGDDVDHSTARAPVFGVIALRDDVELLDRFERKELKQAANG